MYKLPLVLFILLLASQWLFAAEEKSVIQLEDGACWLGEGIDGEQSRVSSFNDRKSYVLNFDMLGDALSQFSTQAELLGSSIAEDDFREVFLHCGGYGSSVVFNFKKSFNGLCIWSRVGDNGQLQLVHMGVNVKGESGGCFGAVPGKLIATLHKGVDHDELLEKLDSFEWKNVIDRVEFIGGSVIKILLNHDYNFKEETVKQELEKAFSENYFKVVEYDYYSHHIGEFYKLEGLSTKN